MHEETGKREFSKIKIKITSAKVMRTPCCGQSTCP
jgi:hypothetical protein